MADQTLLTGDNCLPPTATDCNSASSSHFEEPCATCSIFVDTVESHLLSCESIFLLCKILTLTILSYVLVILQDFYFLMKIGCGSCLKAGQVLVYHAES